MKKIRLVVIFGILFFSILGFTNLGFTPIYFEIPTGFPKPVYDFKANPLTKEGFELGRKLFYDPVVSKDSTISCANCHLQQTGFTHVDHDLSHGINGKIGIRNSLTLQNLAWSKSFMWDGGVNHLDVQAIAPITSEVEMNETLENVVEKLNKNQDYKKLFLKAFGSPNITGQLTLKAISQFVVSLTTSNSKYDKVIRKEEQFTEIEEKGYELFKQNCASCHTEPLFTNYAFKNNGLPLDKTLNDLGRMKITQNPKDSLKFKVPTLRNVEFTFPYMHDGRFKNLTDVLKHYNLGIQKSKTLSEELQKPMNLSDNQRIEIISFLKTLTDKTFLFNPKYGFPKNK
ncbi:cytochrome-c peroxidase [Flavobacterium sp.]|uniref:cytochrome-c peroxidase n=1 Tax=Flavobacterium sp. TaxID=239 RepID=UPI0037520FA8